LRRGDRKLKYRPELDGLRAVAVISVLLCHLGTKTFPGGYVGVDVFFVLSGFLISQIIAGDLEAGNFSIAKFYERRIRRIVPALVCVCTACTVAAAIVLFPHELRTYASSLLAAVFSVSNVWFAANTSYFDPAAATQPLLHTWSLGVEEQFYVFFPLLLSAVFRFDRRRIPLLVWSLIAASLALSIILSPGYSRSSYFLIHTRTWELLTGAVLGLGLVPSPVSKGQREAAAALGFICFASAIVIYTSKTSFPGYAALVPCVGTALFIWAGGQTVVGRMLSIPPMVFVGLISYSLYLWHWPLIVFAKLILVQPFTWPQQVLLSGAAFGLSVLTWRFVETPFRRRSHSASSRVKVFAAGGASLGAVAACALAFLALNGWPSRFPTDILGIEAAAQDWSPKRVECHFDGSLSGDFDKSCVLGAPVEPSIIVYGDSHGAELSVALASLAETRNESVRELTASGCPPALDFTYRDRPQCPAYNAKILKRLTALPPKTIILTSNAVAWTDEYSKQFFRGLQGMIHALSKAGHRVILMGQIPPHPNQLPVPATLARRAEFGKKPANYVFRPKMQKLQDLDAKLEKIAVSEGARYISLVQALCDEHGCKAEMDGKVLYFDDNHMSVAGQKVMAAKLLAPILWPDPIAAATKTGDAAGLR
jgi:peptidoglycan/LPS O-acetylase OafA/YrhL